MVTGLSLKFVVLLFLICIKYSTTLERCDSNVDCDEGFICCKITKMCVANCTKTCREDSDCGSGKCCDSNNTCTENNCSEVEPAWVIAVIIIGGLVAPSIFLVLLFWLCPDTGSSSSSHGGGAGYSGGYGGDGCGGDGGGGCGA